MARALRHLVLVVALTACASLVATLGAASLFSAIPVTPGAASSSSPSPSAVASARIPTPMLDLYEKAALVCPGLPWTVLAAIGTVESDNGSSTLPGVHSGANYAGAEGPMQFEPATFAAYDEPAPPGGVDPPSPYDPADAVYAAVRMLCAQGAAGGRDVRGAIFAYNHSDAYVSEVLSLAGLYAVGRV